MQKSITAEEVGLYLQAMCPIAALAEVDSQERANKARRDYKKDAM